MRTEENEELIYQWLDISSGLDKLRKFEPNQNDWLRGKSMAYQFSCECLLFQEKEEALNRLTERMNFCSAKLEKEALEKKWKDYFSAQIEVYMNVTSPVFRQMNLWNNERQ